MTVDDLWLTYQGYVKSRRHFIATEIVDFERELV